MKRFLSVLRDRIFGYFLIGALSVIMALVWVVSLVWDDPNVNHRNYL